MLFKKKNGQVSIEVLAILGVLIIGSIILASFYISNINKKTSEITSLDKTTDDFGDWLNDESGTINDPSNPNNPSTCGNSIIDTGEQCDGSLLGGATCVSVVGAGSTGTLSCASNCTFDTSGCSAPSTCGNGSLDTGEQCDGSLLGGATCASVVGAGSTGTLSCASNCTFDTSGCSPMTGTTGFTLVVNPKSDNGYIDTNYSDMDFNLQIISSSYVDVNVTVTNQTTHLLSSNCSIDGAPIPATSTGYYMGRFTSSKEYYPILKCNNSDSYTFNFTATDDTDTITKPFLFTTTALPGTGPDAYALCGTSTNENGTLSFCVNNFTATTTNENGTLKIFVNQPDRKESTGSACTSNSYGTLCISVGHT